MLALVKAKQDILRLGAAMSRVVCDEYIVSPGREVSMLFFSFLSALTVHS